MSEVVEFLSVFATDAANPQNSHFWVAAASVYGGHLAGSHGSLALNQKKPERIAADIAALAQALWRQANEQTWRMTDDH